MAKLTRQTQKLFGKDGNLGRFGSAAGGSPVLSPVGDLADMQSLPAYTNGWNSAVLGGEKRPPLEEFNTLHYINNYQTGYLLQEGIAEYDAGTTYYQNSIARESGTTKVYKSLTDDNISNPLTDPVNWALLGDLSGLNSIASNTIVINTINDFPAPVAGVITLESGKEYLLNNVIISPYRFAIPTGGYVRISSNNLSHALVYVGGGTMFTGSNFALFIPFTALFQCIGGTFFNFEGAGSAFMLSSIFSNCVSFGSVRNATFTSFFTQFDTFTNGFVCEPGISLRSQVSFSHTTISKGTNAVTDLIKITGTDINALAIQDCNFTTAGVNESILNLDPTLKTGNTDVTVQAIFNTKLGGNALNPNSLKQDYVRAKFFGCTGIPDSTVKAKLSYIGNTQQTTITGVGTNTKIATNVNATMTSLERILIQDIVTLNFTTDTLTTTFNHGLVLNDRVFLKAYTAGASGTLPPELNETTEYYVVNPTATTFQLSLTAGGAAVNFSTNGTGTIHYRHDKGVSNNLQFIYIGLEDVTIAPDGWVGLINSINSFDDMRAVVMKIATDGTITEHQIGSPANTNNTRTVGSILSDTIDLKTGEGVSIRIRNDSAITNIIGREFLLNLKKA